MNNLINTLALILAMAGIYYGVQVASRATWFIVVGGAL